MGQSVAVKSGREFIIGRYRNVSILDVIGAKDDRGDDNDWSYNTCEAPAKSSPPTNQHSTFYRSDAHPAAKPTASELCTEK